MESKAFSRPLRCAFFGDSGVGKTTLCYCICYERDIMAETTIGVDKHDLKVTSERTQTSYDIEVWDTAGQELFQGITIAYTRNRDMALVVFAFDEPESFTGARRWISKIRNGSPNAVIILIGNKSDKEHKVSIEEALNAAAEEGVSFIDVSATQHYNINMLIRMISESCDDLAVRVTDQQPTITGVSLTTDSIPQKSCC